MKRLAAFVLALAALLAAVAFAQAPVPPYKARVVDLTGTLTTAQAQALESSLRELEQRKGSQIAILMVPTVRPESIEQYSIRVAESWKSGRKSVDDGLIIVVAKNDREVRIEVGRGLEGAIPDVIASRVIREIIVPRFRDGDYYGGLTEGTRALTKLIDGEPLPAPTRASSPRSAPDVQGAFVILLILAFVAGGILSRVLGRGLGAFGTGGIVGVVAFVLTGLLTVSAIAALVAFVFTIASGGTAARYRGGWGGPWGGGWGGGGFGGGFGGGGFGGGGGGTFGGGGASGRW